MNYKKHFRNKYKLLKERMLEKNKGFWKVQSIHKLKLKLSSKFNAKDFLMLKTIQNTTKTIPQFISFSNDSRYSNLHKKQLISIKKKLTPGPEHNIFLTSENQKKIEDLKYKERKKQLYINLYKDYSYEPYLYNKIQFIYLRGRDTIIPRKFNEVLKDCFIMDKYNKLLQNNHYKALNSNDSHNNKYDYINIKLTNSNIDNNKDSGLNSANRKRNMKYIKSRFNNWKINNNYSNTAYDGFYKNAKSEGVFTLPSLEV